MVAIKKLLHNWLRPGEAQFASSGDGLCYLGQKAECEAQHCPSYDKHFRVDGHSGLVRKRKSRCLNVVDI